MTTRRSIAPRQSTGGPAVTQFDTIADLVTASQGGLAEGYYEVLTVPATHPQFPRVLTYWDGATFEPQISTGFESRPTLANERFVWDAEEGFFRQPHTDQAFFVDLLDLSGNESFTSNPLVATRSQWDNKAVTRVLDGDPLGKTDGAGTFSAITIILAGDLRSLDTTSANCLAAVGNTASNQGIALFNESTGLLWNVGWWAASDDAAVGPRANEDVAILTCNGTQYKLWVNGAEILSRTGLSISLASRWMSIFSNFRTGVTYPTRGAKVRYCSFGETFIDDTAAAAWTAWLQDRYGIPPL